MVVADIGRGTRAICPTRAPALLLKPGSPQASQIAGAAIVHVDQAGYGPIAAFRSAGQPWPPLSVDAGNAIEGLDVSHVSLFVPTLARLAAMFGGGDGRILLARVAGPDWVVATAGAAGAYFRGDAGVYHVPAYRRSVCVSTLGAGDVFHGALIAAWVRGMKLPEAVAYAGIAASLSCAAIDGRSAIPDHATVMDALPGQVATLKKLTEV